MKNKRQTFQATNSIRFPSCPDAESQMMHHFTHSHHPISLQVNQDPFTCSGCKERGAGKRFACHDCDFQLHEFCALSPSLLTSHPLHVHHQLVFYTRPKTGGIRWPTCNVCGKSTKGFMFRCKLCHFQMHPCCAMLSNQLQINYPSLHAHPLSLLPTLERDQLNLTACRECNRKRSGRLYGCRVCGYHVHAVCAKDLINGLNPEKQPTVSVLGPAVRFASQAVAEFIGGLIDGIGEGVGEALVQNITRSPARR